MKTIYGILTSERVDSQGDIVDIDGIRDPQQLVGTPVRWESDDGPVVGEIIGVQIQETGGVKELHVRATLPVESAVDDLIGQGSVYWGLFGRCFAKEAVNEMGYVLQDTRIESARLTVHGVHKCQVVRFATD